MYCVYKTQNVGFKVSDKKYINSSIVGFVEKEQWDLREDHRKMYDCILGVSFSLHFVFDIKKDPISFQVILY